MESYALKFDAVNGKRNLPASGNLFVYESASVAANAETRIRVKPDNGGVIVLKPGQWFRNPDDVQTWAMESYNGSDVIDAVFVIGYGEFGDANTLNKFTLDASLANNVTVTNSLASPVNVALNPAALLKLDTSTPLNIAGSTVQFTNATKDNSTGSGAVMIMSPAANVNGAWVELSQISFAMGAGAQSEIAVVMKNGIPASSADGVTLHEVVCGPSATVNDKITQRIKVPAGNGLYWFHTVPGTTPLMAAKTLLYTLL